MIAEILVQEGETVEVGTKLAVIAPEGAESAPRPHRATATCPSPRRQAAAEPSAVSDAPSTPPTAETRRGGRAGTGRSVRARRPTASGNGKSFVSPVVARIASEHGVDPGQVQGTGRGGRVTKKDILAFVESGGPAQAAPAGSCGTRSGPGRRPRRLRRLHRTGRSGRLRLRRQAPAPAPAPVTRRSASSSSR